MVDNAGQKFIMDQSLADIETQVDPAAFYRVNRKYLVNMSAIKRIKTYPKSKLLLEVQPLVTEDIIISQENAAAFKQWMRGAVTSTGNGHIFHYNLQETGIHIINSIIRRPTTHHSPLTTTYYY